MTTDYDSILTHPALSPLSESEFYAEGAGLADRTAACAPRPESILAEGWLVGVLLLLLCLLGGLLLRNRHYLAYRIREYFTTGRHFSDVPILPPTSDVPQTLFMMLSGCLGVSVLIESQLGPDFLLRHYFLTSGWLTAALCLGAMAGMLLKVSVYELVGWTFFRSRDNRSWMSSYTFLTAVFSVLAFLISILFLFAGMGISNVWICLLSLLVLYEILLFSKLLSTFHVRRYGNVLFFLYFCSVEIMPMVVLWHLFGRINTN